MNNYDDEFFNKNKNLPNKIKKSLEKGKLINKEWDNNNIKLNSLINDCLDIENNIQNINMIDRPIENYNSVDSIDNKIQFLPDKEIELNEFFDKIKKFGEINNNYNDIFKFKFKPGSNYSVSNNGLMATKDIGGDNWNCTIIGDKEIPNNKKSEWKIKITNFQIKNNMCNLLIGIGPNNPNNVDKFYNYCWVFVCGKNNLILKSGNTTKYNNHERKSLKAGDIIKVIVDRKLGNLSFEINGENYGIACSNIPKDDILYPVVMINEQGQIVEIV